MSNNYRRDSAVGCLLGYLIGVLLAWILVPIIHLVRHYPKAAIILLMAIGAIGAASFIYQQVQQNERQLAAQRWAYAQETAVAIYPTQVASLLSNLQAQRTIEVNQELENFQGKLTVTTVDFNPNSFVVNFTFTRGDNPPYSGQSSLLVDRDSHCDRNGNQHITWASNGDLRGWFGSRKGVSYIGYMEFDNTFIQPNRSYKFLLGCSATYKPVPLFKTNDVSVQGPNGR